MARKKTSKPGKGPRTAQTPRASEPPEAGKSSRVSRKILVRLTLAAAAVLLVAAAVAAGLFEVRPGEIAIVPGEGGEIARVYYPGRHWRLPFGARPLRLPTAPLAAERDVEVRTAEGAAIVLAVEGRFALAPGRERDWLREAGWQPFVDGLGRVLASRLQTHLTEIDPAELFRPEAAARLTALAAAALGETGVTAEGLAVRAPVDRNPVAVAVARNRAGRLARPTGRKVLLVGWDGADWLMIRPLLAAGRLPNLARLIERGASGELRSQEPLLSPLVWTSIATGRTVPEHGIADFLVRDPASGELVPISSTSRKVHALWTILPAFGLTTDVVAWWATWPADPTLGTVVSDRVAYQLFEVRDEPSGSGKVYPPEAWEWIEDELVTAEEIGWEDVRRFVDVDRAEFERLWSSLPPERRQENRVNHLRKILATTRSYHGIALELLEEQADLTMVYYEGTDTVGHLFARYLPPAMPGVSADEVDRFGDALGEFYAYADELLGELIAAASPDTTVILVSDHGFFTGEARPAADPSDFTMGAPQWHRLYGVVAGAGPGIRAAATIEGATIFDVAPTVLALLGLPIPGDLAGRPIPALLPSGVEPIRPEPAQLASFEELPRARAEEAGRAASSEMDEERLRELVALGYISPRVLEERAGRGDGRTAPPPAAAGEPAAAPGEDAAGGLEAVATEALNLGAIHQRRGDFAAARRQYEIAVERLPSFGQAWAALAQVASLSGDSCEAFELIVRGFTRSKTMPNWGLTGLIEEGNKCGRLDDAEDVLEQLRPRHGQDSAYHAALGLADAARGRLEEALEHHRRALEIDPLDQLANEETVALLRRLGRETEARRFLDQAFERARGKVTAMNQLAVVALRQGWSADAERLLSRVLDSDPGNPGVLANLAAAQMRQGKRDQAMATMREAVERDPNNGRNHFNLGAMLAEEGRAAEALRSFEAAIANGLRSPQVHIAAAKMHFRLGDQAASARELEKALVLEPGNQEAEQLLAALRSG